MRLKSLKRSTILSIVLLTIVTPLLFSFPRPMHDDYMTQVLFGDKSLIYRNSKEVEALKCASYLAIDQFNAKPHVKGYGKDELAFLKQMGVKNLPKDIFVTNFSGNHLHRSFTHRGWNFNYPDDRANWSTRKEILINTINKIFNLSKKEADSFGALIYYIHVLGDHIDDQEIKSAEDKIEFVGRLTKYDIVHELPYHFSILFKKQKKSPAYQTLLQKMRGIQWQVKFLYEKTDGMTNYSVDDFEIYKAGRQELMNVLIRYVPELLRDVDFFREKFPRINRWG